MNETAPADSFAQSHLPQLRLPAGVRLEVLDGGAPSPGGPAFTRARILRNEEIAPEHFLMRLYAPVLALGGPGQFAMIRPAAEAHPHPTLPRPMAVYRYVPQKGEVEFVYRVVGEGTRAMAERRPGEEAEVVGPVGRAFAVAPGTKGILLVGRGIGVCSLTALAQAAAQDGLRVYALLSGRNSQVVLGAEVLGEIGAEHRAVSDAEGTSAVERVAPWLERVLSSGQVQRAYACGSNRLIALTTTLAERHGVEVQVSLEAHMACGLGYCHSCATGAFGEARESPLVCRDGPVFRCRAMEDGGRDDDD